MNKKRGIKMLLSFVVAIYAFLSLYPLIWVIIQSLKTDLEFYQNQFAISLSPQWINYANAWEKANFSLYYKNSILVTTLTILIIVFACSLNAYAISKIKFKGKKIYLGLIVSSLFLPGSMLLFPVYMIVRDLGFGLMGSHAGLIGPYVAGAVPVATIIFKGSFDTIPNELSEAAKIDGCKHFRILWNIMLPLIKPSIATICIVQGMAIWNEFLWALMTITDPKKFTLPIGLNDVASKIFNYGYGTIFAGMVMTTLPVIITYALLQKQFIKAVTAGAVKG